MGEKAEFYVECTPNINGRLVGEIKLSVLDNPYEECSIQLIGEGYEDDVTIDNIRSAREIEDESANNIEIADNAPGKCLNPSRRLPLLIDHYSQIPIGSFHCQITNLDICCDLLPNVITFDQMDGRLQKIQWRQQIFGSVSIKEQRKKIHSMHIYLR
jgi:hypothetical protein